MKKVLHSLAAICFAILSYGQSKNNLEAFQFLETNYNNGNYEAIYERFSPEMQKALPLEQTKAFFSQLQTNTGKLTDKTFEAEQEEAANYKATFEKGVLSLLLSVNDAKQISGLYLKPIVEEVELNRVNALKGMPKHISDQIFNHIKNLPENTQFAVALVDQNKVDYYGAMVKGNEVINSDNKHKLFEIGSITKLMTSAVMADAILAKKIKVTDEVNGYYPYAFHDDIHLTFETLSNHTSGLENFPSDIDLSDSTNPFMHYDEAHLDNYLQNLMTRTHAPHLKYSYSNIGTAILGHTLGIIEGKPIRTLIQEQVLDRYGMSNTYVTTMGVEDQVVKGQNEQGEVIPNWELGSLFAMGGISSTVEDMAKFMMAQFDTKNKALTLLRKTTFSPEEGTQDMGLAWHINKKNPKEPLHWHSGGTSGYTAMFGVNMQRKVGAIVLSNVSGLSPIRKHTSLLAYDLLQDQYKAQDRKNNKK